MDPEKYKDVEIEGRRYRIGRLSPLIGNWIATVILKGSAADEETFGKIQAHCLDACSRYEEKADGASIPVKVFSKPDRFLASDLADDLIAVNELQEAVLDYNLGPFFERVKEKLKASQATS